MQASTAPWLDINPLSFLQAAEAGARIGQGQADLAERSKEAAGQLGLGYARLGTESAQAAAAQKEAQARLALEQNRLTQLGSLGQQRIGLSNGRLGETERQHNIVDDLGQQRLDIAQQAQDTRQQTADNILRRYGPETDPMVAADFQGFLTDPLSKTEPQSALKKYPMAVRAKGFMDAWKNFSPNAVANTATFLGPHGSTYRVGVSDSDAASALGTNAPASIRGLPAQAQQPAPPPNTPQVGQIYKGYKFIGGDPSDPLSWKKQ